MITRHPKVWTQIVIVLLLTIFSPILLDLQDVNANNFIPGQYGFLAGGSVMQVTTNYIDKFWRYGSVARPPRISEEPLAEDSPCFVDRWSQYNEIPPSLIGAQFIQVSDADHSTDIELDLILLPPVTIYLFLDNRLGYGNTPGNNQDMNPDLVAAGMDWWVAGLGFLDTGMDIGIDEGSNGVINQWSSVYALTTESITRMSLYTQNDLTNSKDRHMYGVAFTGILNTPPVVNAGVDQVIPNSLNMPFPVIISGQASDDGFPQG